MKILVTMEVPDLDPSDLLEQFQDIAVDLFDADSECSEEMDEDDKEVIRNGVSVQILPDDASCCIDGRCSTK